MNTANDTEARIADNARSLLESAELLYRNGHFPRALSLAILCIEECGKLFLIQWNADHKKLRRHPEKQSVAGSYFSAQITLEAILKFCEDNKLQLSVRPEMS